MLYVEDLPLITDHRISQNYLYTIRKGELVWDNVNNQGLLKTDRELIKIREDISGNKGCVFFNRTEKICEIYPERPSQCRALKCWDTDDFIRLQKAPSLCRSDIFQDGILLGLIQEHERRCDYLILEQEIKKINRDGHKAVERILEILRFDYEVRPFIVQKLGLGTDETDLVFGRPLIDTITMFGLEVINRSDGTFFLTVINQET